MTGHRREDHRVLAIDPTSRGFGFVVLEGPASLIDWGTRDTGRADSNEALRRIVDLLDQYGPDAVVLEDTKDPNSRRCRRVRELIGTIKATAAPRGIEVARISRMQIRALFSPAGATTKHRIASVVAEHFPELDPHLPPPRKAWMSEDARMSIFDAAAFALTFYFHRDSASEFLNTKENASQETSNHPRH